MGNWTLLEIEPTRDVNKIKKAYAKKLKKTHPDEQPEEFQKLKEAFDWAMKWAKGQIKEIQEETETKEEESLFPLYVNTLMQDYQNRIEKESWEHLLHNIEHWTLKEYEQNRSFILVFLKQNFFLLPQEIAAYLLEQFALHQLSEESLHYSMLIRNVLEAPRFSFIHYGKISEEKRDFFYLERYRCYALLSAVKINDDLFQKTYKKAAAIYKEDQDLKNLYVMWRMLKDRKWLKKDRKWLSELNAYLKDRSNKTTLYLQEVLSLMSSKKIEPRMKNSLLACDEVYLSNLLKIFITGMVYYYEKNHQKANQIWGELPAESRNYINRQLLKKLSFYRSCILTVCIISLLFWLYTLVTPKKESPPDIPLELQQRELERIEERGKEKAREIYENSN